MTGEEFDKIVDARIHKIKETLSIKAKEYRRNDNALHNFEAGAYISGKSPLVVLDGFLLKHIVSYNDMINDISEGKLPTEAYVDEKLGDIINYFVLQEAQIKKLINEQ